jgi:hypothetical protein
MSIEAIDAEIHLLEQQSNEIGKFTFYASLSDPKLPEAVEKQRQISNRCRELQLCRNILAFSLLII